MEVESPVSIGESRSTTGRRPGIAGVIVIIAVPVLMIVGFVVLIVVGFVGRFEPSERNALTIGESECFVEPSGAEALIQLPILDASPSILSARVETLGSSEMSLIGVATLPADQALDSNGVTTATDLRTQLNDDNFHLDVATAPSNVVLEVHRSSREGTVDLESIRLWWSVGEPAFVQTIPLALEWTGTECTVSTN